MSWGWLPLQWQKPAKKDLISSSYKGVEGARLRRRWLAPHVYDYSDADSVERSEIDDY